MKPITTTRLRIAWPDNEVLILDVENPTHLPYRDLVQKALDSGGWLHGREARGDEISVSLAHVATIQPIEEDDE